MLASSSRREAVYTARVWNLDLWEVTFSIMPLQLQLRQSQPLGIDLEGVLPERLNSREAIANCRVRVAKQLYELDELFAIRGTAESDQTIEFTGDLACGHRIGQSMTAGTLRIAGSAGRHLGQSMRGGMIEVQGHASDYTGCELAGGEILVQGSAGDFTGGALPGSVRGMTGGAIFVGGSAGRRTGEAMRRGLLVIGGTSGDHAGYRMLAGTIVLANGGGAGHGSGMKRGTIAILGSMSEPPMPTFTQGAVQQLLVMKLLARDIGSRSLTSMHVITEKLAMPLVQWHGDLLAGGRGELLLAT